MGIKEKPAGTGEPVQDGRTNNSADNPSPMAASEMPSLKIAEVREQVRPWVYIGPTIPRTKLIENSITKGTLSEVEDFYKSELEVYPEAKRLIVSAEELAASRFRVKTAGNLLSKIYTDLNSMLNK